MMTTRVLAFVLFLVLPAGSWADQISLDELVEKERAVLDNEAVSVYGGEVSGVEAVFFIEWAGTGSPVEGRYYLPVRGRNVMFILKGSNPQAGVLELEEFLDDGSGELVLNATCKLKKRISEGSIVWEGEKIYPSGRPVTISFARGK